MLSTYTTRSYYRKESAAGSYTFSAFNVIIKNIKRPIVYMQNYCNIVHNSLERCCAAYSVTIYANFFTKFA